MINKKEENIKMRFFRPRTRFAWSTAIEKTVWWTLKTRLLYLFYMLWRLRIILITCPVSLGKLKCEYVMVMFYKTFLFKKRFFVWHFRSTIYAPEEFIACQCMGVGLHASLEKASDTVDSIHAFSHKLVIMSVGKRISGDVDTMV